MPGVMRLTLRLGAAVLLVLLAGCLDPIPPGTLTPGSGTVHGVVRRRCGEQPALSGAQISVDGVIRATTDATGTYRIDHVGAGESHVMTADLPGYIHTETVVQVSPGEATEQNFALETPSDDRTPVAVDLLFVIDNTAGMVEEQAALIKAFPALAEPFLAASVNLHLGIVTSDLGAGPTVLPNCTPGGDDGLLKMQPVGVTCDQAALLSGVGERFLSLVLSSSGEASANFSGTLEDAFACYAPVGTDGCDFGMPLEAMARVLSLQRPENGPFLRQSATLLVILLSDRDDCSTPPNTTLFDPFQTTVDTPLGPLTHYRCFEFGTLCEGTAPGRTEGPRYDCRPGTPDLDPERQLTPISRYLDLLAETHGGRVVASVIAGPPAPVEVGLDSDRFPTLLPACLGPAGGADPAPRLTALTSSLTQTNRASICGDLGQALRLWARQALDLAVSSRSCEE